VAFDQVVRNTNNQLNTLNRRAQKVLTDKLPTLTPTEQNELIDKVQAAINKGTADAKAEGQIKPDLINSHLKQEPLYEQF
jgi:hypothetical protein